MKRLLAGFDLSFWLIVALGALAGSSVTGALTGLAVYWAAAAGAIVAATSTLFARRFRLLRAEAVIASLVSFGLAGGFVAGTGIRPDYRRFFDSLIAGWADLLSSVPPVAADEHYRVLPFALAWLAATGGFALASLWRVPAIASVASLATFGLGLLFSVEVRTTALVQGALLTVGALALGWRQQREYGFEQDETLGATTMHRRRTRFARALVMLVVLACSAPAVAGGVPGFEERERFDLRNRLEPPWNALNEPSPLAQIKANYADAVENEVAFTVRGNNIPKRWRLAALGVFDGTVWTVGDISANGRAPFVPIDQSLPVDPQWLASNGLEDGAVPRTFEVEVGKVSWPWLPLPHQPIALTGLQSADDIRFNAITRTAAQPSGAASSIYEVSAAPDRTLTEAQLARASFVQPASLGLSQQSGSVADWAADILQDNDDGWPQLAAIQASLIDNGAYSTDDNIVLPGHSWARLRSFFDNENPVGYEEQYAAAAAIAARNASMTTRVVVGYLIEDDKLASGEIQVTRSEISAWIEVLTAEYGWVPIDVTPDRNKEPEAPEDPGFRIDTVAVPNPPPPPAPPSETEIEVEEIAIADEEVEEEAEPSAAVGLPTAFIVGGTVGTPFLLVGGWAALVAALKGRRRKKRFQEANAAKRIRGAWSEANDRLLETGDAARADESVAERCRELGSGRPAARSLRELAQIVDRSVFGREEPTPALADRAWLLYDEVDQALEGGSSVLDRLRRRVSLAPLRKRTSP